MTSSGPSPWLQAAQQTPEPIGTPPGDLFFQYTKPDGDTFIAPATSAETYLRKGYTITGEQTINDSDAFREVVSPGTGAPAASGVESAEPEAPSAAKTSTTSSKSSTSSSST